MGIEKRPSIVTEATSMLEFSYTLTNYFYLFTASQIFIALKKYYVEYRFLLSYLPLSLFTPTQFLRDEIKNIG